MDDHACGDEGRGGYHAVPVNFLSLIPISLKRTMEFHGFAFNDDNLTKLREAYQAMGPEPSNTRWGWRRKA